MPTFTTADHLHQNVQATPKYEVAEEEAGLHATMRAGKEDSLRLKQHRQWDRWWQKWRHKRFKWLHHNSWEQWWPQCGQFQCRYVLKVGKIKVCCHSSGFCTKQFKPILRLSLPPSHAPEFIVMHTVLDIGLCFPVILLICVNVIFLTSFLGTLCFCLCRLPCIKPAQWL